MLTCLNTPYEAFKQKGDMDGVIIEPSIFVNNFVTRSLDKFGVLKAPENILLMIKNDSEKTIPVAFIDSVSPLREAFSRPIYNNMEGLFTSAVAILQSGNEVFSTPKATALFIEWLIKNEVDVDVNFNIQVDIETIYNSYAEEENKSFVPVVTERLIKLFSIFYGKGTKSTKFLSSVQLNLLDAEKKQDMSFIDKTDFQDVIKIVEKEALKHVGQFSTNNLFNKLLENLHTIEVLKQKGYNFSIVKESLVLNPKPESLEESRQYIRSIMEG